MFHSNNITGSSVFIFQVEVCIIECVHFLEGIEITFPGGIENINSVQSFVSNKVICSCFSVVME